MTRPGRITVVVLATALVVLSGCQHPSTGPAPATSSTVTNSAAPATPQQDDRVTGSDPAPADPGAVRTADRFVHAWARPALSEAAWLAGVRPYATPGYAAQLATVDPANVPASTVLGSARVVQSTTQRIDLAVATNAGDIEVTCVRQGAQWLVLSVQGPQPS